MQASNSQSPRCASSPAPSSHHSSSSFGVLSRRTPTAIFRSHGLLAQTGSSDRPPASSLIQSIPSLGWPPPASALRATGPLTVSMAEMKFAAAIVSATAKSHSHRLLSACPSQSACALNSPCHYSTPELMLVKRRRE